MDFCQMCSTRFAPGCVGEPPKAIFPCGCVPAICIPCTFARALIMRYNPCIPARIGSLTANCETCGKLCALASVKF